MTQLQPLLLLLLGWLLGLLAPAIQYRIRQNYRAAELRKAILGELDALRYEMAWISYMMWNHLAPLTDDQFGWLEPIVRNDTNPEISPTTLNTLRAVQRLSEAERREVFIQLQNQSAAPYPKELTAPLLEAHVSELATLPMAFQAAILRIKAKLDRFNQHVVFVQKRHDKTFDSSLSDQNHQMVLLDLKNGYRQLAEIARSIADAIAKVQSA